MRGIFLFVVFGLSACATGEQSFTRGPAAPPEAWANFQLQGIQQPYYAPTYRQTRTSCRMVYNVMQCNSY